MAYIKAEAKKGALIHFNDTIVMVDTIYKSAPVREFVLVFMNKGKEPLVVKRASTDCPCTSVTFDQKPVEPKREGLLKVKLDLTGFLPGEYKKKIRIGSNSTKGDVTIILNTVMVYD